jgi:molybdopterin converting factor small subunit
VEDHHHQEKVMGVDRKAAIAKAQREIQEEAMEGAVKKLKAKYRERNAADTVVANLNREIEDLEEAIEQGNA